VGFSPIGLIISLAVLVPNLLLLMFPPRTPIPRAEVARPLTWLERGGQALCLVVPAMTLPGTAVHWWAAPTLGCLVLYYALWGRYVVTGRSVAALYRPLWRVPVPMAIVPVLVFLGAAAWLSNVWIAAAALIFAIGHLPTAFSISTATPEFAPLTRVRAGCNRRERR